MLMPHPAVLHRLVHEYETLAATQQNPGRPSEAATRAQDLAYTLCVTTGTRDVAHALATAHRWLARAGVLPPEGTGRGTARLRMTGVRAPDRGTRKA